VADNPRWSSNLGAHIPSSISDLCAPAQKQQKQIPIGANHTTMHLDAEKSVNDNSLQHVSFFSVSEQMLMKK